VDTGPLVAYLDPDQKYHRWAEEQVKVLLQPLFICEPVLTEAMFLLKHVPAGQKALFRLLENGALTFKFSLSEEIAAVKSLLSKYVDIGISLADACLIRMSELNDEYVIFTLDSDFHIYRKHGRQSIQLISPSKH